jgi:mono/diheme cytochrome c family protein
MIIAMSDLGEGESLETSRDMLVDQILKPVVESWQQAPESIVQPPEKPEVAPAESIAQGRELFYGVKANCVKCHGVSALGDGQASDYDDWNKQVDDLRKNVEGEETSLAGDSSLPPDELKAKQAQVTFDRMVLSHDALPPRTITPRNLRQNIYRGGRRPVDLYRRISVGINGVPMPGVGPASPGASGTLTPEEIWALVDYVRSLPYDTIGEPPRIKPLVVGQASF